jgi:putative tryptophan/tyrosine transport system ATP-binding protein
MMLHLENISVKLGKGSQLERQVLHNLNLHVQNGEFVVLIGSNGAGKSTLFNTISGHVLPGEGHLKIDHVDITSMPTYKRAEFIATVIQDPRIATFDHMTLEENLSFALMRGKCRGLKLHKNAERLQFFKEKLKQLDMGLEDRLFDVTSYLSGGQRQALSLIMATLTEAKILLLDELTAALDPKMADVVMNLTSKIVKENHLTTLMITHNMEHALKYGDRMLILKEGHIVKEYDQEQRKNLMPIDLINVFNA